MRAYPVRWPKQLRPGPGAVVAAATTIVLLMPQPVETCAPLFERAIFTHVPHPDFPLTRFAGGDLGVLLPSYARSYLAVAFRHLSARRLNAGEQAAVTSLWTNRLDGMWDGRGSQEGALSGWEELRATVAPSPVRLQLFKPVSAGAFFDFRNCLDDAFRQATATLTRVTRAAGAGSPAAADWVRAQDIVFGNCGGGSEVPNALPAAAQSAAVADRTYQRASALFYAGRFDEAAALFAEISSDRASPWQAMGTYLAARSWIRKGTLTAGEGQIDRQSLERADRLLQTVVADPAATALHESAQGLRGFVRFRLDPRTRFGELAAAVGSGRNAGSLEHDLGDYTLLLDRLIGERAPASFAALPAVASADELTDWITTFQSADPASLEHALTRWSGTGTTAWLVAALSKIQTADSRVPALRDAAARIGSSDPAWPTVAYHLGRLAVEAGNAPQARDALAAIWSTGAVDALPRSSINLFLAQRMQVAADLDAWLRDAARQPASSTLDMDGTERPTDAAYSRLAAEPDSKWFDLDAASALNARFPLSRLAQIAEGTGLPARLRRNVAVAAWTRAVLVGDDALAQRLSPTVATLAPELAAEMASFAGTNDPTARRLTALVTILRFPGMRPRVDAGLSRETPSGRIDNYRNNWWCAAGDAAAGPDVLFLSQAERSEAAGERERVAQLGTAPTYLGHEAVRLARLRPDDPLSPEALHLAVRATRYGCADDGTGGASRAAFDLLHQRYPDTEWAQKTPYWFKG
jgi:hypothetical protein